MTLGSLPGAPVLIDCKFPYTVLIRFHEQPRRFLVLTAVASTHRASACKSLKLVATKGGPEIEGGACFGFRISNSRHATRQVQSHTGPPDTQCVSRLKTELDFPLFCFQCQARSSHCRRIVNWLSVHHRPEQKK